MTDPKCIFCKIVNGGSPETRILFKNDEFTVFPDIKPASTHHYLVVTNQHIKDAKQLGADDLGMVEKLAETGLKVLDQQGGDKSDVKMGFHWPPFHSVAHLHLHVISPSQEMGLVARGMFRPNSFWFVTVDWVIARLIKMKGKLAGK